MAKLTRKLIGEIARVVEHDDYTISEICAMFGISRTTFYNWKDNKPEFAAAIDEAAGSRDAMLLALARKGLKDRLEGYTVYTEKVVMVPDDENEGNYKVIKKECVKREYGPDLQAIKYVLDCERKREKERDLGNEMDTLPKESEPGTTIVVTGEERKRVALYERYGSIMNMEDATARHQAMFLRDKMRDGTHPKQTGIPMAVDWEKEYEGM